MTTRSEPPGQTTNDYDKRSANMLITAFSLCALLLLRVCGKSEASIRGWGLGMGTKQAGLQRYAEVRTRYVHVENISLDARETFLKRRATTRNGAARGDAKWRGASSHQQGIRGRWGGRHNFMGVGRLGGGARPWALRACPLIMFVLPTTSEKSKL